MFDISSSINFVIVEFNDVKLDLKTYIHMCAHYLIVFDEMIEI